MRLPKLSIENTAFTWMLFIMLLIFGVRAYMVMPRTENPTVLIPGATIIAVMPGASPVDIEKLVALPIEDAINELEDVNQISTSISDGYVTVSVEFDYGTDPKDKYDEVVQQFNTIRSDLPEEVAQTRIWRWSSSDAAMLQMALVSDSASFRDLRRNAETLQTKIEKVESVRSVNIIALPEEEIHIILDFRKMARVNTSINMVANAIVSNNANIPGGEVEIGMTSLNVKSTGSYVDVEEIRNTVVNSYQGRLIYLKNIATVDFGYQDLKYLARFGGDHESGERTSAIRGIFLTVNQKEDYNVLQSSEEIEPILEEFRRSLPEGLQLEMVFNQPVKVRNRINNFMMNLLQGIILVGIIIFLSLGFRSSIVVIIAIPLSIIIGLGFLDLAGFGLEQISIAGLIVALGLLVDNSIVMVENIDRYMLQGHKRKEASYKAASEIGWPIVTATLTTVFAFIPIAAMPDQAGEFIKSLPVTIALTLSISLLIALTLTPTITASFYKERVQDSERKRGIRRLLKWIIEKPFRTSLNYGLKHPLPIIILAFLILGASGYMFKYVGVSFFPKAEQPNLMIQANLPEGSSLKASNQVAHYIENMLDTMPEVKYYATNVGNGNPRIYYNEIPKRNDLKVVDIYVELYEYEPFEFEKTLHKLRNSFEDFTGARINVKEFTQGPPFDAPIQVFVTGNDLNILRKLSSDVEEIIGRHSGVINLDNLFVQTNTELLFDVNKEKANIFGVPLVEIDRTIRTALAGIEVSSFRDKEGEEYRILVKGEEIDQFTPGMMDHIYVASMSGRLIPLKQFVNVRFIQSSSSISRNNLDRTAEIQAAVETGFDLDEIMDEVVAELEAYPFPDGFEYSVGGEVQSRKDAFSGLANAVIIAIISILSLLVLQFRSLRQPFLVFLAIPFAGIGMVWALFITGNSFSFTAFIGLTSLIGIVVNNSIILVDYTNKLRRSGKSVKEAVQVAAETRLTPIVLTAFTTIGGLLPLTLRGGSLWAPMGWTIIGGLLVSTVMTLLIVPLFYSLMEREEV
ncbi:efflux RND transporter permease subunit [Bacteroidota bacterium]